MKKSDKTFVFVFVPVASDGVDFENRLRNSLAAFSDTQPQAHIEKPHGDNAPFWTWFLPNPLPKPDNADL